MCVPARRLLLILLYPLLLGGAWARSPAEPIFHSDFPTHSGRVLQLAATADERYLVSGGFDHTVRVWQVEDGRQIQRWVLPRPDDRVHALAVSPDGAWIALGGDVSAEDSSGAVLVIALQTGRLVQQIAGLKARVGALAFSADNRHLAIGFKGERDITAIRVDNLADQINAAADGGNQLENGITILRTTDWQAVFSDGLTRGEVQDLAFTRDHRLLVATEEAPSLGVVALYQRDGERFVRLTRADLTRRSAARANWVGEGKEVRVGFDGRFDGRTLAPLPLNDSAQDDSLRLIRHADDGRSAAFHGQWHRPGGRVLLGESGSRREADLPDALVNAAVFLGQGRLAYVADNGTLALLGRDGQAIWRRTPHTFALNNQPQRLQISADGEWVRLPYETEKGLQETAFHLESGRFAPPSSIASWQAPPTSRRGLTLQAWENTATGTANGFSFAFENRGERSLSAIVHPTDFSFFYGSNHGRLYRATILNRAGMSSRSLKMWERQLGSDVVAINLIEASNRLVVATADGVLRVLRSRDGAVLLSYFIQPAERKWLAVAETGHYVASVGGEDFGGWVLPRRDGYLADFYPMSRFREQYLLPDMIPRVLAADDGSSLGRPVIANAAPAAAPTPTASAAPVTAPFKPVEAPSTRIAAPELLKLPPSIDLLSPGFDVAVSEPRLTLRIRINTPAGAPVTHLSSRVVASSHNTRGVYPLRESEEQTLTVSLPPEDSEIRIIAENRWGASTPRIVRVRYTGQKTAISATARGTLRIVAIGVSDYDNPRFRLDLAAKDARDFSKLFPGQQGRLYEKVETHVLTDRGAGKRDIETMLGRLQKSVRPEDTTFVFLAGHGINDEKQNYFYLPREADLERLAETAISFRQLRQTLAELPGRNLLFVDTCHAGNVLGNLRAGLSRNNTQAINEMASPENNIIVFASSSGEQESVERRDWGNGAFTKALLEGLRGEADFKKRGRVTYKQLDAYVSDRVYELTNGLQTPVTPVLVTVPDFPLTVVTQ